MFYKQLNFKSIIIFKSKIFLDTCIITAVKFITAEKKNLNQFNLAIHDLLDRMPQFSVPVTLEGKHDNADSYSLFVNSVF
jgi:hypothetical protein